MSELDAALAALATFEGDGIGCHAADEIVATYVLQGRPSLAAAAEAVAIEESTGTRRATADVVARVGGEVRRVDVVGRGPAALGDAPNAWLNNSTAAGGTDAEYGRVEIAWPTENATSLPALWSLAVGEANETGAFGACRLVRLDLPAGLLGSFGGPQVGAAGLRAASGVDPSRPLLGAIVKPSTGLGPAEFASVAAAMAAGGADLIKDDELLGDPPHCRFTERVTATRAALATVEDADGRRVLYAPNCTGPVDGLLERIAFARDAGCGAVMLNVLAMGLDVLRWAAATAGVPILAHRVSAGGLIRSPAVGATPEVLAGMIRVAGGDLVLVGGIGGKLFEDDDCVLRQAVQCGHDLGPVSAAMPLTGGGQSAGTVMQTAAAFARLGSGRDFCHLLGAAVLDDRDGVGAAVGKAAVAWAEEAWAREKGI